MKKDKTMGNHYHRECRAFFYLISGKTEIRIKHLIDNTSDTVSLKAGQGIYFLPFEVHKVHYLEDSNFILLKSYRYRDDAPDIFPEAVD
jgi:mannose-6-phosphate isomerase-like protein (cupin superfamily)